MPTVLGVQRMKTEQPHCLVCFVVIQGQRTSLLQLGSGGGVTFNGKTELFGPLHINGALKTGVEPNLRSADWTAPLRFYRVQAFLAERLYIVSGDVGKIVSVLNGNRWI